MSSRRMTFFCSCNWLKGEGAIAQSLERTRDFSPGGNGLDPCSKGESGGGGRGGDPSYCLGRCPYIVKCKNVRPQTRDSLVADDRRRVTMIRFDSIVLMLCKCLQSTKWSPWFKTGRSIKDYVSTVRYHIFQFLRAQSTQRLQSASRKEWRLSPVTVVYNAFGSGTSGSFLHLLEVGVAVE